MNANRSLRAVLLVVLTSLGAAAYASDHAGENAALKAIIDARSEEDRARDPYRNPVDTLAFFQVAPGMTVAEGLPGRGWYTRIIAPYLGADGAIYGVNYADRMWPLFSWVTPEIIAQRIAATAAFPGMVADMTDSGVSAAGFTFEAVPDEVKGSVDRVLLIRALHNLNRFEAQAQTRSRALAS
ncbi:MAG: methyltransferase, partial [Halioglobus sp.]